MSGSSQLVAVSKSKYLGDWSERDINRLLLAELLSCRRRPPRVRERGLSTFTNTILILDIHIDLDHSSLFATRMVGAEQVPGI